MRKSASSFACIAGGLLVAAGLAVTPAKAEYPEQTIRIIVAFPAGGSTDIAARVVADKLSAKLGQTIVIENMPGASGLLGASAVARAKPDGYTLLATSNGIHSAAAAGSANFVLDQDLVAVSDMVGGTSVVVASTKAPFKDIKGFVDYAKNNKELVNTAINAALGSGHMTLETFRRAVGINFKPIYYSGEPPSLAALVSGESWIGLITAPVAQGLVKEGKVVGLAVTTKTRTDLLPDVPTLNETVAPGFHASYSTVVFAPKGTPKAIVDKLSKEIAAVVNDPAMKKPLDDLGLRPIGSSADEYGKRVSEEFKNYAKVIAEMRASGVVK